jgi:hypothetical protein
VSTSDYLTLEEVVARYRGQVSEGTLRNWRTMRIGPSYIKIGKAVLYPASELDRWDKSNLVVCRGSRSLSLEECAPARCTHHCDRLFKSHAIRCGEIHDTESVIRLRSRRGLEK